MNRDFYQIYMDELEEIEECSMAEEGDLLLAMLNGDPSGKKRLIEGNLKRVLMQADAFENSKIPAADLLQEGNMALTLAVDAFSKIGVMGNKSADPEEIAEAFHHFLDEKIREAMEAVNEEEKRETEIEKQMADKVNFLNDTSSKLASELGREATKEELAKAMKLSEDEIETLMKQAMGAIQSLHTS